LIVWTRILTPGNRSVTIASYGADRLGRSGTGGAVDSRFGTKFGGAAAISIIGAGPAAIAGQTDNKTTADTISNIGDDLAQATDSVIGAYLSIPPTIYVRQGASVTIILDRLANCARCCMMALSRSA
jgi:type IV secretion system protein VirB10